MFLYQTNTLILLIAFMGLGMIFLTGCNGEQQSIEQTESEAPPPIKPEQPPPVEQKAAAQPPEPVPVENPQVKLETNLGDIVIQLNPQAAPMTVENFLRYVSEGFYDDTIFHRVIVDFMIQGGGLTVEMQEKKSNPPIINEASNGLKNDRGTISMARTPDPHSATSQFFINLVDNDRLDYDPPANPGYTVFGKVVEGLAVVDKIGAAKTTTVGRFRDVPVETVVIIKATIISK